MDREQKLRASIMNRVYGVYVIRTLLAPHTRYAGLVIAAFVLTLSVSIKDVLLNAVSAAGSPSGFLYYVADALATTEILVQAFTLIMAVLLALMIRDFCVFCISQSVNALKRQTHHSRV